MKIKMKTRVAGPDFNVGAGQVVDVPRKQAYALIEGGYAEQVREASEVETAVAAPVEAAVETASETATEPVAETSDPVVIPDGWRKLSAAKMKALAASLGTEAKNKDEAQAAIEAAGG